MANRYIEAGVSAVQWLAVAAADVVCSGGRTDFFVTQAQE